MLDFRNCSDKSEYHDDWQKLAAHKMNKMLLRLQNLLDWKAKSVNWNAAATIIHN